jgi:hypothetical protein
VAGATRTKRVTIGTLSDAHFAPGQKRAVMQLKLNGKGLKALRAAGTLAASAQGTFSNSAGGTPVTKKLKLILKR